MKRKTLFFQKNFFQLLLFGILFLPLLFFSCSTGKKEKIFIGRDPQWSSTPFDGITENINAFTNAVFIAANEHSTQSFSLVNVAADQLLSFLDQGKIQGILTSLDINIENNQKYLFSSPILPLGPVIVTRIDLEKKEFKNRAVGTLSESQNTSIIQALFPLSINYYDSTPMLLDMLENGSIDVAIVPSVDALLLVPTRYKKTLKINTPPLTSLAIRLAVPKDSGKKLMQEFEKILLILKKKGIIQKLENEFIFSNC